MKMNYRLIRNTKHTNAGIRLAAPFAAAIVLALFQFWYPSLLQRAAHAVAAPFFRAREFSLGVFFDAVSFVRSKRAIVAERDEFLARLLETEALLADRNLVAQENALLKEQLNRADSSVRILAAVLASPPRSPYDTIVIDAGEDDGVFAGDTVMSGATAIGTVSKTFSRTALVEMFSTAGRSTAVFILSRGESLPAEALGQGGGMFKIRLPKDAAAAVGDSVALPGLSPFFLGVIEGVEARTADSFHDLYFTSAASVWRDLFVTVVPLDRSARLPE